AADAIGRPVLLFFGVLDEDHLLPGRIREAREWLLGHGGVLASALREARVDFAQRPRVFVVGHEFTASCLQRLRDFDDEWLSVFRVAGLAIDGRVHVGVEPLIDQGRGTGAGLELPEPLRSTDPERQVERLVDFLRRVEPAVRATGDRYSRTFVAGHLELVTVTTDGVALRAEVPEHGAFDVRPGHTEADLRDAILRRYLATHGRSRAAEPPGRERKAARLRAADTAITADELGSFLDGSHARSG